MFGRKLIAAMNKDARAECERANEYGRTLARASGNWDDRPWLHLEDWVRMRPPLIIVKHLIIDDGVVTPREEEILSGWIDRWMERSYWGDCYASAKQGAIQILLNQLPADFDLFLQAVEYCSEKLSKAQISGLLECGDQLMIEGDALARTSWEIARDDLEAAYSRR